jgi:hypothetical protein
MHSLFANRVGEILREQNEAKEGIWQGTTTSKSAAAGGLGLQF